MRKIKPIAVAIAVPVVAIGWYAFRPELLFINQTVNEKLPVTGSASEAKTLRTGDFKSDAHETLGKANLVQVGADTYVRLSNFKTSNGPDVHVYLVKGNDATGEGVSKNGFLDLGVIKGNEGDQNYKLPEGTKLEEYGAVSIWCKRFSVNFGAAPLSEVKTASRIETRFETVSVYQAGFQLAGFGGADIKVTGGDFKNAAGKASGTADIIESNGKRYLALTNVKATPSTGIHVYLVKAETIENDSIVKSSTKLDLGVLKSGSKSQRFEISKDIDVWLYRTVSLWNPKKSKSVGTAELRSAQEKKAPAQTV